MACKDCVHAKDPMPGFPNQVFCDFIYLHISALPYYDKSERCDGYKPKATNADRIRSMTDEELAEFMCHNVSNGTVNCAFCAVAEFCRMGHNGWIDWLRQEASND